MGKKRVEYRCVATSVEGFVQQVAVQYLRHGYWFYVAGQIPEGKDPAAVDAKLVQKYGIDVSRWERARRKRAGLANMQYIRHERYFLLLATHGRHRFFEEETKRIRDARKVPLKFDSYSLSFRSGRVCVRLKIDEYLRLKARFVGEANRLGREDLQAMFLRLPFAPYAPVRQQLLQIWRTVNRVRQRAGRERIRIDCVPWKRQSVKPFKDTNSKGSP